jgi:nucleotidyltransferase substrate binding protein (TIGR01987 family)
LAATPAELSESISPPFRRGCASRREKTNRSGATGHYSSIRIHHELAWNTLKDFLELTGATNLFGSVNTTRAAFAAGLIENGEAWMEMIKDRNLTTHTYDERTADKISSAILSSYVPEFGKFAQRFAELEKEAS